MVVIFLTFTQTSVGDPKQVGGGVVSDGGRRTEGGVAKDLHQWWVGEGVSAKMMVVGEGWCKAGGGGEVVSAKMMVGRRKGVGAKMMVGEGEGRGWCKDDGGERMVEGLWKGTKN